MEYFILGSVFMVTSLKILKRTFYLGLLLLTHHLSLSYSSYCHPSGQLYSLPISEIICEKNHTIFKGCHHSLFYITISSSFWKIVTKNLNSDLHILIFLVLGTNHQLHISYLSIRSDHDIEAATHGYS